MKEKYIFFILLIIAVIMLLGRLTAKEQDSEISNEELRVGNRLKYAGETKLPLVQDVELSGIEDSGSFQDYARLNRRSLFSAVQTDRPGTSSAPRAAAPAVAALDEKMPLFVYRGKINSAGRLVVILEQTRSGETVTAAKGESVNGYKVLDISDTEVILSKQGEEDIVLETIIKEK